MRGEGGGAEKPAGPEYRGRGRGGRDRGLEENLRHRGTVLPIGARMTEKYLPPCRPMLMNSNSKVL